MSFNVKARMQTILFGGQKVAYQVLNVNAEEQKDEAKVKTPAQHHVRNDIQTLRGLAIAFVLLFHLWPTRVSFGFLGVDMFFVISGYLMCMILARKRPLTWTTTVDFYFRRIKRIVPLYLCVLLLALGAIQHFLSPIEFDQIVKEAIPALGFYSNMPGVRETNYFDISSKLSFFLHTWSLSVEIQFYLIVPLLVFALDRMVNLHPFIKWTLISVIPIASFVFQCLANGDRAHMLLVARIWQFFVGFAAYYVRERNVFEFTTTQLKSNERDKRGNALKTEKATDLAKEAANLCLHSTLVLLFVFGIPFAPQLGRLVVVLLASLIIGRHNETSLLSNWRPIVTLGDVSYSVYLIHWPLFTWHRYSNSEVYVHGGEADLMTGLVLIFVSLALGYAVENAFKWFLRFVRSWSQLLLVLSLGFLLNGTLLYILHNSAVDLNAGLQSDQQPTNRIQQMRRDIEMLWTTREHPPNLTKPEVSRYNTKIFKSSQSLAFCDNQDRTMPTNYPLNMSAYRQDVIFTCHAKGEGTKNIVLIGNSHGLNAFPGIAYIFRHTYKRLTMFTRVSCLPTVLKFEQFPATPEYHAECMHLANATAPALREWKYPIDIVIALYALISPNVPLTSDIEQDELFTSMRNFYSEIAKIPREALIIQQNQPNFPQNPMREVESRIKSGRPLNTIGETRAALRNGAPALLARTESLSCPKCLKLDLISEWCNRTGDNFCHSTSDQGLIYFADKHHPSALGSFYNADYMLHLYRQSVT